MNAPLSLMVFLRQKHTSTQKKKHNILDIVVYLEERINLKVETEIIKRLLKSQ